MDDEVHDARWWLLALLFGLQIALLFGGGRVRAGGRPPRTLNRTPAVLIFSVLMLLLSAGLVVTLLEMTDRTYGTHTLRGETIEWHRGEGFPELLASPSP